IQSPVKKRSAAMDAKCAKKRNFNLAPRLGRSPRIARHSKQCVTPDRPRVAVAPGRARPPEAVQAPTTKCPENPAEGLVDVRHAEVAQLKAGLAVVEDFRPKKASVEETEKLVEAVLAENAFTEKQMGQAMGIVMKKYGQQVDPGLANAAIKRRLAGK